MGNSWCLIIVIDSVLYNLSVNSLNSKLGPATVWNGTARFNHECQVKPLLDFKIDGATNINSDQWLAEKSC